MALKGFIKRLRTPIAELDDQRLRDFCCSRPGVVPIGDVESRQEASMVGEITSVRIVPQPAGTPWLEVTITDGTGTVVAMWTGRKRIAGIRPGQRLVISGRGAPAGPGGRLLVYNPIYELI